MDAEGGGDEGTESRNQNFITRAEDACDAAAKPQRRLGVLSRGGRVERGRDGGVVGALGEQVCVCHRACMTDLSGVSTVVWSREGLKPVIPTSAQGL